jgi:peptidyl-prolyl cis-trans isomerase B (cyclophilin B)
MTRWTLRGAPRYLVALCILAGLTGCGKQSPAPADPSSGEDRKPAARAVENTKAEKPADPGAVAGNPLPRDRQHQTFAEATRDAEDPPANADRPPDQTISKKSVAKLLTAIRQNWDRVRFLSASGKKIDYSATIETTLGNIEIALFPDLAPNHVRNFVVLARAGYYDELFFDRIRKEKGNDVTLRTIEAGCPLGDGDSRTDSLGYWLKPEFQPGEKISHDEGTVGACRGVEPDSAGCRFYITLNKAPFLDGNYTIFGKVVSGLDVARRISMQPVGGENEQLEGALRPEKPVQINKVTIHTAER